MPNYLYRCTNEQCEKREFEEFHSISTKLEECPTCHAKSPERLISAGTSFILSGGGWASSGYSR